MANVITITVPNPQTIEDTYGTTGKIRILRATSKGGSYGAITPATTALVSDQTTYRVTDADGAAGHWYKYQFENSGGTVVSGYSDPFPGRTPTTKTLQYVRQQLAKDMGMYDSGEATASIDVNNVRDSSKVSTTLLSNDTYRGSWLMGTEGNENGQARRIAVFTPSLGNFLLDRGFTNGIGSGETYDIFRWCHPQLLTDAINDALGVLVREDVFYISGVQGEREYALPYWIERKSDILRVEWQTGQGITATEGVSAIWHAWGASGFTVGQKNGENILMFDTARGDNEVFRIWALRPYVADYEDRLSAETDPVFAPLDQLLIGAKLQAYSRLAAQTGPGEAKANWERERDKLLPSWMVIQRRQRGHRSQPVRGHSLEQWV